MIDGVAGARSDLAPAPSVDIANGAPTGRGRDEPDRDELRERDHRDAARVLHRVHRPGRDLVAPRAIETAGDRGFYAAPAISPNGTDVYVVYNAFTTPFRTDTTDSAHAGRRRHARGLAAPGGADRARSPSSTAARRATRAVVAAQRCRRVPRRLRLRRRDADVRRRRLERHPQRGRLPGDRRLAHVAADRRSTVPTPAPQQDCPAKFGNSDIYGGSYPDPTP